MLEKDRVGLALRAFHHRLRCLCIGELIEAKSLQVHDIADVETEDPIVCPVILHT